MANKNSSLRHPKSMNPSNKWVIGGKAAARNLWTLWIWLGVTMLLLRASPHEMEVDELAIALLDEVFGVENEVFVTLISLDP